MTTHQRPQPPSTPPARYEIRRRHDHSPISAHCCAPNALQALEDLTLADMMGTNPPGPLQPVDADIIDTTTGEPVAWTGGLVPLDGQPPAQVHTYR